MELHRTSGRRRLGFALAAATMALWGVLPLALEIALRGLDAVTIIWLRMGFAGLVMGGLLAARGRLGEFARIVPSIWGLLGVATLFLGLNYLGYMLGLERTNAATAQVLLQLAPLLLALGGIFVFREPFNGLQWTGFAVLLAGLAIFSAEPVLAASADGVRGGRFLVGLGLLVFAALTWAVYGLAQKQLLRRLSSQQIMVGIYVGCALGFAPFADPAGALALEPVELAALMFCAVNTVLAYGFFSEALAHWEASRVSSVLALTPLATLGFVALGSRMAPALVEPEPVAGSGLFGAGLVVAGSLLASLGGTPQAAAGALADPAPSSPESE